MTGLIPSEASLRDVPEVSGAVNNILEPPNSPLQAHLLQTEPPRVGNSFRSVPLTSNSFSQWLARTLLGTPDDNRIKVTKSKGVYVGAGLNPISASLASRI